MRPGYTASAERYYSAEPLDVSAFFAPDADACPLIEQLVCMLNDKCRPDHGSWLQPLRAHAAAAAGTRTSDPRAWRARVELTLGLIDELRTRTESKNVHLLTFGRRGDSRKWRRKWLVLEARHRCERAEAVMAWGAFHIGGATAHDQTQWGAAAQHAVYSLLRAIRVLEVVDGAPDDSLGAYPPQTAQANRDVLSLVARLCAPAAELAQ